MRITMQSEKKQRKKAQIVSNQVARILKHQAFVETYSPNSRSMVRLWRRGEKKRERLVYTNGQCRFLHKLSKSNSQHSLSVHSNTAQNSHIGSRRLIQSLPVNPLRHKDRPG